MPHRRGRLSRDRPRRPPHGALRQPDHDDHRADFSLVSFETSERVRRGRTPPSDSSSATTPTRRASSAPPFRWPTTVADDDEATYVERTVDGTSETTVDLSLRTRYTRSDDGVVTVRVGGIVTASREVTVVGTATS